MNRANLENRENMADAEYLWSARAEYGRHLDNVRALGRGLEQVGEELESLRDSYELPEGCSPDPLLERLAEAREVLAGVVAEGERKVASFHEALVAQGAR